MFLVMMSCFARTITFRMVIEAPSSKRLNCVWSYITVLAASSPSATAQFKDWRSWPSFWYVRMSPSATTFTLMVRSYGTSFSNTASGRRRQFWQPLRCQLRRNSMNGAPDHPFGRLERLPLLPPLPWSVVHMAPPSPTPASGWTSVTTSTLSFYLKKL